MVYKHAIAVLRVILRSTHLQSKDRTSNDHPAQP